MRVYIETFKSRWIYALDNIGASYLVFCDHYMWWDDRGYNKKYRERQPITLKFMDS